MISLHLYNRLTSYLINYLTHQINNHWRQKSAKIPEIVRGPTKEKIINRKRSNKWEKKYKERTELQSSIAEGPRAPIIRVDSNNNSGSDIDSVKFNQQLNLLMCSFWTENWPNRRNYTHLIRLNLQEGRLSWS